MSLLAIFNIIKIISFYFFAKYTYVSHGEPVYFCSNLLQIKVDLQHIAVKHLSSTQINELHIKN